MRFCLFLFYVKCIMYDASYSFTTYNFVKRTACGMDEPVHKKSMLASGVDLSVDTTRFG
jgi:hypothetical protein